MKLDVETMIVGLRAELSVQEIARRAGISRGHAHRLLFSPGDLKSHEGSRTRAFVADPWVAL